LSILKTSLYGIIAGIVIIMIAIDIIVLSKALLPLPLLISLNFVIIGVLLLVNAYVRLERMERVYYSLWGLFFLILSLSIGIWNITGDGLMGLAIFLAGIGGLVIYASFSQK